MGVSGSFGLAAVAVATLLVAGGCAAQPGNQVPLQPTSIALSEAPGWPADAPYPEGEWENPDGPIGPIGPIAWWGEDRETITFISYGSSSCPFVATELTAQAEDRVSVVFVKTAAEACTDDLAAHTHVLAPPDGLSTAEVVAEVQWREPGGDYEDRVQEFIISIADPAQPRPDPPPSAAIDEYPGLPELLPETEPGTDVPDTPLAYWLSPPLEFGTERELTIVTHGSSSCPMIPTAVDAGLTSDTIGVTLQVRSPEDFCTADMAPFTSVLAIPLEPAATATFVEFTTLLDGGEQRTDRVQIVDLAPPR